MKFQRDELHRLFCGFLYSLCPQLEFMHLFSEVVREVWKEKNVQRDQERELAFKTIERLEYKKQRLLDMRVEDEISKADYEVQVGRVGTALQKLKDKIQPESTTESEVDYLLEFAEWFLPHVGGIWNSANLANRMRLQDALYPAGLSVAPEGFRTAPNLFFHGLLTFQETKTSLASLIAASWNPLMERLKAIGSLRDLAQKATH